MKRTTTTIPATESTGNLEAAEIPRLPIAFYSDGYWLALEGGGKTYLHIGDGKTDIECRSRLERLVFGYGSTCKEAMARLTWYRYGITDTEKSRTGANAAAEGRLPIPFETVGRHHEDFFTDEGWSKALGAGVAYLIPEDKARSEDFFTIMQSLSFAGVGCICFPISQGSDSKNPLRFARQTLELAMVAPLFLSPGEENVQDPMERGLFSRARAVFEALAPYRRQCLEDWKSEGIPFFCHPWIRYEGQKELLDVSDCLMVGSDLVISESPGMFGRAKTLRLPDDDWVHLWTSRRFGGGRVSIDAPPGVPALFYREKSKHGALFDQIRRMATRL